MQLDIIKQDRQRLVDELEKVGVTFRGNACNCCFHDDAHASGGVYQDETGGWKYKCQACGFGGDIFDVIAKRDGISLSEAVRRHGGQAETFNGRHSSGDKPKVYTKAEITDYLKTLGDLETVHKYHTGKGEVSFYVARIRTAENEKTIRPFMPQNGGFVFGLPAAPRVLYGLPEINKADTILICEGEKCCDILTDYDITSTTSCGGAKNARHSDWTPLSGKNCLLWPDNDVEGRKYMQDVQAILAGLTPPARVSFIEPSSLELLEKEDVFDFVGQLKTIGKTKMQIRTELQGVVGSARPRGLANSLSEKFDKIISGELQTIKFPFRWTSFLSNALLPGTLAIICGNVGASKSFMLLQCLVFWYQQNVKCCCYELEEDTDFHLQRTLAQLAGDGRLTDFDFIAGNPGIAKQTLAEHGDFLNSFGHCLEACPESQLTQAQIADWILARAKAGNRIVAVDPITALLQAKESWIADNAFLQNVKRTATEYGCSIVLITHPVKSVTFADVTQLSGSAAFSRFSQTILWLESHEPKISGVKMDCGTTEASHNRTLHILKARNGKGQGVSLACEFSAETLKLDELGVLVKKTK